MLVKLLKMGNKTQQISNLNTLKIFLQTYFIEEEAISHFLIPKASELNDFFCNNKVGNGILVSAFLGIFLPKKFSFLLAEMVRNLFI